MRAQRLIALGGLATILWAVPNAGAAHLISKPVAAKAYSVGPLPLPARFRVARESGLLIRVWLDGSGPYIFAIDTGAGLNLITERVAAASRLQVRTVRPTIIGGLSAARKSSSSEAVIAKLALGDRSNPLPSQKTALIVPSLAPGIDGVLDPTESYSPYGYSIDISNELIEAVDPASVLSRGRPARVEGAVVPWLRVGDGTRPFVRLGDGRIALVDTGSGFGLAVSDRDAVVIGSKRGQANNESIRDIGGGMVLSRRVSPTTISIGDLVLRGIPTDILSQVDTDAPVILGRDALYPFKITFDPRRRLIEFVTSQEHR